MEDKFSLRITGNIGDFVNSKGEQVGQIRCRNSSSLRNFLAHWNGARTWATAKGEQDWKRGEKQALAAHRSKLLADAIRS